MSDLRLLVVVAHPDDESFGCGSVLARASSLGMEAVVCCASRGEAGQAAPGSGVDPADLGAVRERELMAAADVLGVARVVLLEHRDSGMTGDAPPGAIAGAPPGVLAGEIRQLVDELQPDVVVTLDASDGHRDHRIVRDATLDAVRTAQHRPARTYLWCLTRSSMARWIDHLRSHDAGADYRAMGELGTPDADITTVVDVADLLDRRWAAIRSHRSQVSPYDGLPEDLQLEFLATDRLVRVDPPWTGGPFETDPFAGPGLRGGDAR